MRHESVAHTSGINAACWIDKDMFCTAAASQVSNWKIGSESPFSILENGNTQSIISLSSKLSSKGRYYVCATSGKTCNFYKLK